MFFGFYLVWICLCCKLFQTMTSNKEAGLLAAASEDPQSNKTRMRQEQEEKLILATWHNMQHSLSEDSGAPGLPQSFLAKQRQSTQARRAVSPQLEPSG
ncbi:protein Hook homolog 2 [Stegastes partitus]|uniref:Protein Hook homolog 2 n=1 Tax=Stegastes partitus TaxID=144197 RepID=A0A9Y4JKL8_9TELE|nr:PREDICTED: protein Hook homolog 2 [Stegastes partitus]